MLGRDANAFGVNYHSVVNRVSLGSDAYAFGVNYYSVVNRVLLEVMPTPSLLVSASESCLTPLASMAKGSNLDQTPFALMGRSIFCAFCAFLWLGAFA